MDFVILAEGREIFLLWRVGDCLENFLAEHTEKGNSFLLGVSLRFIDTELKFLYITWRNKAVLNRPQWKNNRVFAVHW